MMDVEKKYTGDYIRNLLIIYTGVLTIIYCFLGFLIREEYYKEGQIDAIKGNVKYKLVIEPDSVWVKNR